MPAVFFGCLEPTIQSFASGFFEVTDDGLADAIIAADAYSPNAQFFYVENISTPVVACVTDLNGDGETDIDDLLQVMGAWGPCL